MGQVVGVIDGKDTFAIMQGGVQSETCGHLVLMLRDSYDKWINRQDAAKARTGDTPVCPSTPRTAARRTVRRECEGALEERVRRNPGMRTTNTPRSDNGPVKVSSRVHPVCFHNRQQKGAEQ